MNPTGHGANIEGLVAAVKRQQWLTAGAVCVALLLAMVALTKQSTTILEPPSRTKTIAMTGDRVDAAWLEEMGAWIAHMMLDASPASIAYQQDQVLRWTHPATHGSLQQDMAIQARRLADTNAATVFWLQETAPDPDRQRVVLVGQLDTYVNGVKVPGSNRTVSYLAAFETKGGRMLLKEWKPVSNDDIWASKALEAARQKEKDSAKK